MTRPRFVPLAVAIASASLLVACNTTPAMPMGTTQAGTASAPSPMAMMDGQMKTMGEMHEKMKNAKTAEERSKLMAEHMKAMQAMMQMMKDQMPPAASM